MGLIDGLKQLGLSVIQVPSSRIVAHLLGRRIQLFKAYARLEISGGVRE